MPDERACARGTACEDRVPVVEEDGTRLVHGAPTEHDGRALCPTCLRQLVYALQRIPYDVAELTTLMVPSAAVRYRPADMPAQPRIKLAAPIPMNLDAEALRALIDYELTVWAESVAAEVKAPWDSAALAAHRQGARVQLCCTFLLSWLDHLLGLPEQEHRARSRGENPLDGHDLDHVTYDGQDYWVRRNGTDAALLILDLHLRALAFAGWTPVDRVRVPCPGCDRPAMVREHHLRKVVCRCCWRQLTDDQYEQLVDVAAELFGVSA